jgi:hypothetical protein
VLPSPESASGGVGAHREERSPGAGIREHTFALIAAWAEGRPQTEQNAAFDRLWPCLRLHHMSTDFLACVVARSNQAARLGFQSILSAFNYHSISARLKVPALSIDAASPFASYKPSRAPGNPGPYHFEGHIDLVDCKALEDDGRIYVNLGVAAGYRAWLSVQKIREPVTVGLFAGLKPIFPVAGAEVPGPIARVRIQAGGRSLAYTRVLELGLSRGWWDFFGKPWDKVVCDGSSYFPQGRMVVKVTVQFLTDKHVEPAVGDLPQAS